MSSNNYAIPAYSNFRHTTIPSIKVDHVVNSNIKVSGYFSVTHTTSPNSNGFPAALAPQDDTSYTTRVNYDQTITPTLLLHLGAGLLYFNHPAVAPSYDQSQLWASNQQFNANNLMPNIGGLSAIFGGGMALGTGFFAPGIGVSSFSDILLKDIKPTFNASLTWVRGDHTYKAGGEMVIEGFPQQSLSRANRIYNFSAIETSNPWENGSTGFFTTGFPYASFLLGKSDSLLASAPTDTRLGNHSLGLFVQDTWKVTRKLTVDYGLRWDYVTLLNEQYGRMGNAAFNTPNPAAGGLLGDVIYGATCNCDFNNTYKFAFGPRLGAAYQITPKTVFRACAGLAIQPRPTTRSFPTALPTTSPLAPLAMGRLRHSSRSGVRSLPATSSAISRSLGRTSARITRKKLLPEFGLLNRPSSQPTATPAGPPSHPAMEHWRPA